MKILVYSSVFYPAIGGIENHSLFLVKEFVKAGHTVKVITEQAQDVPLKDIEIFQTPVFFKQLRLFFWSDVFYMPNITLKGVWLMLFNPWKNWVISHNDFHLKHFNNWKTKLKFSLIKRATTNIAVSRSVADFIKCNSKVVYNCYNDGVFRLYTDEKRVFDFVFVGRLVSQKGCELLIDACGQLNRSFTLNIIGDGYEMERLQVKVEKLGLNHCIHFLGFMQDEKLARALNRHRVMIVPSLDVEGFGIVALEGMACGCRLIVSEAGGLSEAVNRFGNVFPMGSIVHLRALLEDQLSQEYIDSAISGDLSDYLKEHSRERVAAKYLKLFEAGI